MTAEPKLAYASSAAASAAPTMETAALSDHDQQKAAEKKAAPFALGAPKGPSATPAPAPWVEAAKPVMPATVATPSGPALTSKQTMAISAAALRPPEPVAPPTGIAQAPAQLVPKKETLGERFARGELPKPPPDAPPIFSVAAPAPVTSTPVPPAKQGAAAPRSGGQPPQPTRKKPLDKSPEGVAERMSQSGVS
jgi:hypothetical protein